MLVEDDPDIGAIATLSLQLDPDLVVVAVPNGQAALDRLGETPRPDLILIDSHLPDMDGVTLSRLISERLTAPIPIAFLTAAVRAVDRERYASTGAIGVIAKPFDPMSLAREVRGLLEAR